MFRKWIAAIPSPSIIFLFILFILTSILCYQYGKAILGPFIFGDESTYFAFGRSIYLHEDLSMYTQYGPLFPLTISPLFFMQKVFTIYKSVRLINILLFLLSTIPAFLLGRRFFHNSRFSLILPFLLFFSAAAGFVYLIWAEPLYIFCFYWACYLLFIFIEKPTFFKALTLALLLAGLYYIKPGAGLAVQLAVFFTLCCFIFIGNKALFDKNLQPLFLLAIFTTILLDLPWMLHYYRLGLSIVGYSSATDNLIWKLSNYGYLSVFYDAFKSCFYQFSYLFITSWGLLIFIPISLINYRKISAVNYYFGLFLMVLILALIVLSGIGMASFKDLDFRMPNGRYFSVLIPLVVTYGLLILFRYGKSIQRGSALVIVFVSFITTVIATPFFMRSPLAFNSMPELSLYIYITDLGRVVWRPMIDEPNMLLRILPALLISVFVYLALCFSKQRKFLSFYLILIYSFSLFAFWAEQHYIIKLGRSQSEFNRLYRTISESDINPRKIAYDKDIEPSNTQFFTSFWLNTAPSFIDSKKIAEQSNFDYFLSPHNLSYPKKIHGIQTIYSLK